MLVRVPDYFDQFACLAGDCPHSCCIGWEVVIDEDTARRYRAEPGPLGEKLRAAMQFDGEDVCFPLDGGRCPFLNRENLCEIHCALGAEATSVTCQEHPRFIEEYGPFKEITLSAACPKANELLLGSNEPLTFSVLEDETPVEEGDAWLDWLLPLRNYLLDLLRNREQAACRCLRSLEILEPDWQALLERWENNPALPAFAPREPEKLERIAVYLAFRYLLKAVNDGDLLGRAQFCLLGVLTVDRLSRFTELSEALRLFSREIEHDQDNLDALLDAFWQVDGLSAAALLAALSK